MWLGIVQKKSMVLVKIKQRLGDMLLNLLELYSQKQSTDWDTNSTICISFLELVCDIIKRCWGTSSKYNQIQTFSEFRNPDEGETQWNTQPQHC